MHIRTATGHELKCDYLNASESTRQANIRILDTQITEIATVFANPEETVQLWFENTYVAGFTKLLAIIDDGDAIRVVLGKE